MTPPTEAELDAALAALTGTITEAKPETDLERNMLRLRLLTEAKQRGIPWAVIGRSQGISAKQAKRDAKALARETQRQLLAGKAPVPRASAQPHHVRRRGR